MINLIFVFVYSQIEDNLDLSNELLNDREIQKYMKSFEKFKRYFRSLDDTSESSEDSEESSGEESTDIEEPGESSDLGSNDESSDLGSNDESSDLGSNDESSDLESNDESSDLESNDESSDIGSNDESSDLGSNDESSDLGSNDESSDLGSNDESSDLGSNDESGEESGEDTSTQTPTQTPPTYSPSTQTPTQTPPTYAPSTQTPTQAPTQAPTQTPTQSPPTYRPNPTPTPTPTPYSSSTSINVLLFTNYHTNIYNRPMIITFNLYIAYSGFTPALRVTFTLKLVFIIYRGLQESNENSTETNTTTSCTLQSLDEGSGICRYNCSADTEQMPTRVESLNDYVFDNKSFEIGSNFTISELALETSKNLVYANSTVSKIISLQNGVVFNNDTSTFSIRGQLKGIDTDTIPFTFVDKSKGENDTTKVNVRCTVINKDEDDFQIKCDPDEDLQAYINGTIGILDDGETGIFLNMTEFQNYVNIHKSDDNVNNNNNIKFRKNSSGLSGGAIAGIVIACAVILILVSLIIMCIRKPKRDENNNSSVVGLRTVDNFTE